MAFCGGEISSRRAWPGNQPGGARGKETLIGRHALLRGDLGAECAPRTSPTRGSPHPLLWAVEREDWKLSLKHRPGKLCASGPALHTFQGAQVPAQPYQGRGSLPSSEGRAGGPGHLCQRVMMLPTWCTWQVSGCQCRGVGCPSLSDFLGDPKHVTVSLGAYCYYLALK